MESRYKFPLSVAPMMEVTDSWWRYFARGLSLKTLLYTEMIVDNIILHKGISELIGTKLLYNSASFQLEDEGPIALQLGGNDPESVSEAARLAINYLGSNCVEINLNCGCPSRLVGNSCFGARLMMEPEKVREIVYEISKKCPNIPVTVKHRLGTDLSGAEYHDTKKFVTAAAAGGAKHFIVHARMAVLDQKFSCEQNRSIPPLLPEYAHKLAHDFPELSFALNGGLRSLDMCQQALAQNTIQSTMIGRAAWYQPCNILATADTRFYNESTNPSFSRRQVIQRYADYIDYMQAIASSDDNDSPLLDAPIFRPLYYVFSGLPHAKRFRIALVDASRRRSKQLAALRKNTILVSDLDDSFHSPSNIIHHAIHNLAPGTIPFLDAPLTSTPMELRRFFSTAHTHTHHYYDDDNDDEPGQNLN